MSSTFQNIIFDNINVFNEITYEKALELSDFFNKNDYLLIKDILTDEIKLHLKNNVIFNRQNALDDELQFFREHNDEECNEFISRFYCEIKPFYEYILQKDLTKMLGFGMKYNEISDCIPHYDNYNMPISSTICFYNKDKISYPLYIDASYFNNPHPFRLTIYDKEGIPEDNKVKIDINEGDIALFRGRNHLHWRDKKNVKDYRALLLHTEDYKYNNNLISYIFSEGNIKADVNDIKNINTYALTNINSYYKFRCDYVMYFK